jgi:hypothetical protein
MPISTTQTNQRTTTNSQNYRHVVMLVSGLVFLASGIAAALNADVRNLMISAILVGLVFLPALVERWVDVVIPPNLQLQYALLLVAGPYLGGYWYWYPAWQPWDTLVHLYSGVFASFALIFLLGKVLETYQLALPVWLEMFLLVATSALVALAWEIGEFVFDLVFDTRTQGGNTDTMVDMIAGLAPSLVIALALFAYRRCGIFTYIGSLVAAGRVKV